MNNYPTCATCIHLVQVNCHPWNKDVGKGSILTKLGYACLLPTVDNKGKEFATFMDRDYGTCECHTPKEVKNVY